MLLQARRHDGPIALPLPLMINFLARVLFESLPWLLAFCLVAVAVAVAVHRTRYTKASRRGIWLTLAGCLALLVMQWLVVTDRETLEATVRTMARAMDEGDVATIAEHVDAGFQLGQENRDEFIESVNRTLQVYQVDEARITGVESAVEGDGATVSFWARCDVRGGGATDYNFFSRWRLHFVRRAGRWLMDRIDEARADLPVGTGGGIDVLRYRR